jgi:hypothetical protein
MDAFGYTKKALLLKPRTFHAHGLSKPNLNTLFPRHNYNPPP